LLNIAIDASEHRQAFVAQSTANLRALASDRQAVFGRFSDVGDVGGQVVPSV